MTCKILAASFAALFISAVPAVAQTSPETLAPDAVAPEKPAATLPDAPVTDEATTSSTAPETDFDLVVSTIRSVKANTSQIDTITEVSKLNLIKVNEIASGEQKATLDKALTDNAEARVELLAAIAANKALSAKLDEDRIALESILATMLEADGSVTVYVR